ncbi:MAG: hypothetical protein HY905_14515 [Deltaproteobacteria bacterium]|nr:hypothetical protein [Deltaproteobacteria bacterium]
MALGFALLWALLPALACSRGPVRIRPERRAEAGVDAPAELAPDASPDARDPLPSDRCDPLALLPSIPRSVPGWTADPAPIYPYEIFAGVPVGFVGRLFRSEHGCVAVGIGRPADPEAAGKALLAERPRAIDVQGRQGWVFPSVPANQITIWVRDAADRLVMLRAYGGVDPDVLQPFLDALFPAPDGEDAGDATPHDGEPPTPPDAGPGEDFDAGENPDCAGRYPMADAFDPATFWGPPGECWRLGEGES